MQPSDSREKEKHYSARVTVSTDCPSREYFYCASRGPRRIGRRAQVVLKRDKGYLCESRPIRIGRRRVSSLVDRRGWKNGAIKEPDVYAYESGSGLYERFSRSNGRPIENYAGARDRRSSRANSVQIGRPVLFTDRDRICIGGTCHAVAWMRCGPLASAAPPRGDLRRRRLARWPIGQRLLSFALSRLAVS